MDFFIELALVIGVTILIAFGAKLLRQPLIIAYIISGIIAGPYFLNLIHSVEMLELFSRIGIALLLFIVGLGLSPKIIKEVGKVSLITGLGQVIFTSITGLLIGLFLGFDIVTAIYISIALTFSSTIIIIKLLTDRGDTETLYGKIAIGFLIVQDLVAMSLLLIVSSVPTGEGIGSILLFTLAEGIILVSASLFVGFKIIPKLLDYTSKSQEFLLIFSLGWCLILAAVFEYFGFPIEIGALLAGFTIAASRYRFEISSKLRILRDFFLVLFFIWLGAQLKFGNLEVVIIPIIVFSLFILIGNPLIVLTLMGLLGYKKRNGFMAGLTVAQISEFSIILIVLGINVGHINSEISESILLMITAIGIITIAASSYLILYSDRIYPFLEKFLSIFERKNISKENKESESKKYDCILFGCNRIGHDILKALNKTKTKYFIVDYDPKKIRDFEKKGMDVIYGDLSDSNFLEDLPLKQTKMVVSTIPEFSANVLLLEKIQKVNKKIISIIVSYHAEDAIKLYEKGASYVLIPHFLGGHHTATLIEAHGMDFDKFLKEKMNHINYLKIRREEAPEHFNFEIK